MYTLGTYNLPKYKDTGIIFVFVEHLFVKFLEFQGMPLVIPQRRIE